MGEWHAILGIVWADALPFLLVRQGSADRVASVPATEFRFRYRATPDLARICIGHRLEPGDRVCTRPVQEGTRTCRSCSIDAALFAADLHHAHTRERTAGLSDHLNQRNVLYVAGFSDGSVKIGTSVAHRIETRLLEQGARHAKVVAATEDGVAVRVLEDLVTEALSIAQTVSISRKLAGLTDPRPDSEIAYRVADHAAQVRQLLAGISGWQPSEDRWWNPVLTENKWDVVFRYPRDLGIGAHDLCCLGACGRAVLLGRPETGADRFVADLRQLYGIRLESGVFDTPDLAAQHTLF